MTGAAPMPWSETHLPAAMKNLPAVVRGHAIAIANALRDEGVAEGMAIRIALVHAREWAQQQFGVTIH